MKLSISLLALGAMSVSAHPIQKVIDQMVDLRIKAKEEGEKEALTYNKFNHWCAKETESLQGKIATNNEKISSLKAEIEGHEASIAALKDEISTLKDEIAKREADQVKADGIRKSEKSIYDKKKSDLEDTIKAVGSAIKTLKESKSVLQVRSTLKRAAVMAASKITSTQRNTIHAFLQDAAPGEVVEDPAQARFRKYDFKSGNVIELLETLHDNFEAELLETNKAETNAVNGYDLAKQAQDAAIKAAKASQSEKEKILGATEEDLASAKSDLGDEERDLEANTKTLDETTADCTSRANEFAERSTAREGEQAALSEAISILGKVTGLRPSDHAIAKKAMLFLQTGVAPSAKEAAKAKAIDLIATVAKRNHNAMLQRLSQQLRVAKGPFKQIKNMIQKMVFRLNKEQQDEDAHKNWCDTELETTTQQRDEKKDQVEELTAKVESLTAKIEEIKEALSDAEKNISDTQKYMKDETDLRAENKEENEQTISDAKEAQAALAQAIGVLTQYYKDSGAIEKKAYEFVQQPELGYEGSFSNTDGSSAVMSLLETTLADYSKMEAEAVSAEESEESNFEQDMKENKIELARLRNEVKVKTARKTTLEEDKAATAGQLKKAEKGLEALEIYLKDLEQPCVTGDSSYDERKAARKSEIDALYEALGVLENAFKPKSFLAIQ